MGLFFNNPYLKEYQRGLIDELRRKADESQPYQLKAPEGYGRSETVEEAERRIAAEERQQVADLKKRAAQQVDFEEACEQERARRRGMSPQNLMDELNRTKDHETWLKAHKEATDEYLADIGKDEEAKEIVAQKRRAMLKASNQEHLEFVYGSEDINMPAMYKKYDELVRAEAAAADKGNK